MTIASLLDLGVDEDKFLKELQKLNLEGYEIEISTVQKNGITAKDFKVILEDESHPDHVKTEADHEHSHHDNSHEHHHKGGCNGCGNHDHAEHSHSHPEDDHSHGKEHSHSHSSGAEHHHRNFNDIKELINQSDLSQKVKDLSIDIFAEVAEAEAKVHNKELNEVSKALVVKKSQYDIIVFEE